MFSGGRHAAPRTLRRLGESLPLAPSSLSLTLLVVVGQDHCVDKGHNVELACNVECDATGSNRVAGRACEPLVSPSLLAL